MSWGRRTLFLTRRTVLRMVPPYLDNSEDGALALFSASEHE